MSHWTLNDIPWERFDASRIEPAHLALAKAACMVEHNGDSYTRYLCEVFHDNAEFQEAAINWGQEEVQHGMALRRWVEMADPTFDFNQSFTMFTQGHQLPTDIHESIRGSRCGELIARCVVETGTSTYYTAIREHTGEPVLQAICARIAADEYRHYQLFHQYLKHYQKQDGIGLLKRLSIAIGRVAEVGDNELAFALFSSHLRHQLAGYDQQQASGQYLVYAGQLYAKRHIERMSAMILKVIGLKPNGRLHRLVSTASWALWKFHTRRASAATHTHLATAPVTEPVAVAA